MKPSSHLIHELQGIVFRGAPEHELESRIASACRQDVDVMTLFLGTGTCGRSAGAEESSTAAQAFLARQGISADIVETGCMGMCAEEPLLDVQMPGRARLRFARATADRIPEILEGIVNGKPAPPVLGQLSGPGGNPWPDVPLLDDHPFLRGQHRRLLAHCGLIDPADIDEAIARGTYSALADCLRLRTPDAIIAAAERDPLTGRSRAGIPTAQKWRQARSTAGDQKYVLCNVDPADPGSIIHRVLTESDPHRVLEGLLLASYAVGATKAIFVVPARPTLAAHRLGEALEQARRYRLAGPNILNSGFGVDVQIRPGSGQYIAGEETALIQSLEGRRGTPRPRPPQPAERGLFGKPTVVHCPETLAAVATLFRGDGQPGASAPAESTEMGGVLTRIVSVSGKVRYPGLVEVPEGTSIRHVVINVAGGAIPGPTLKAVQMGGPTGQVIPESQLDDVRVGFPLDAARRPVGSQALVVLDEGTCMVELCRFLAAYLESESCGTCIPCREGTHRIRETLDAVLAGFDEPGEHDPLWRFRSVMKLQELGVVMRETSMCDLGRHGADVLLASLKGFREEFETHVFQKRCLAGASISQGGRP